MPQTQDEYEAAYRAGWQDAIKENDFDPMASAPDGLIRKAGFQAIIPLYVPGFSSGHHSDLVLGRVTINGEYASIHLTEGGDFEKYLTAGAYVGMMVQFPVGFELQKHMRDRGIEWGSVGTPDRKVDTR